MLQAHIPAEARQVLCVHEAKGGRKLDFMLQPVLALQESRPVLVALLTAPRKPEILAFK